MRPKLNNVLQVSFLALHSYAIYLLNVNTIATLKATLFQGIKTHCRFNRCKAQAWTGPNIVVMHMYTSIDTKCVLEMASIPV